jgi:hypothetical protein
MRKNVSRILMMLTLVLAVSTMAIAQGPPAGGGQGGPPGAGAGGGGGRGGGGGGGRGGGGRGGGGIVSMPVTSTAFADGGDIPAKYITGNGVSPELNLGRASCRNHELSC